MTKKFNNLNNKIMGATITVEQDVDIDEFSWDDIVTEAIEIAKNNEGFREQIQSELFPNMIEEDESMTIRDEQYDEVFEQLKYQYSVSELQSFLK